MQHDSPSPALPTICGLLRVRNEGLLIEDTLQHLAAFCSAIIVYDDCSDDDTVARIHSCGLANVSLIAGSEWRADRQGEETRHRAILAERGRSEGADWLLYIDADERLTSDPRDLLKSVPRHVSGLRLPLFDAYLTEARQVPYVDGALLNLSRDFGPEMRRILMLWRSRSAFAFIGRDQREPVPGLTSHVRDASIAVAHYGKAISQSAWEAKCNYYANHFPEPYRSKWERRRGQAIHTRSDDDRPLAGLEEAIKQAVDITPSPQTLPYLRRRVQVTMLTTFFRG